ncbi:MAG: hypothetical protein KatS3mg110_0259 [Pirellulaceae bacterium]|nr:MAG: hypothetical protein KatS3mg110_0259 [Pirellulaceae bacterium]
MPVTYARPTRPRDACPNRKTGVPGTNPQVASRTVGGGRTGKPGCLAPTSVPDAPARRVAGRENRGAWHQSSGRLTNGRRRPDGKTRVPGTYARPRRRPDGGRTGKPGCLPPILRSLHERSEAAGPENQGAWHLRAPDAPGRRVAGRENRGACHQSSGRFTNGRRRPDRKTRVPGTYARPTRRPDGWPDGKTGVPATNPQVASRTVGGGRTGKPGCLAPTSAPDAPGRRVAGRENRGAWHQSSGRFTNGRRRPDRKTQGAWHLRAPDAPGRRVAGRENRGACHQSSGRFTNGRRWPDRKTRVPGTYARPTRPLDACPNRKTGVPGTNPQVGSRTVGGGRTGKRGCLAPTRARRARPTGGLTGKPEVPVTMALGGFGGACHQTLASNDSAWHRSFVPAWSAVCPGRTPRAVARFFSEIRPRNPLDPFRPPRHWPAPGSWRNRHS